MNKTVEWPKFALFYKSFWQVLDRELEAGHFFWYASFWGLKNLLETI